MTVDIENFKSDEPTGNMRPVIFVLRNPGESIEHIQSIYSTAGIDILAVDKASHAIAEAIKALQGSDGLLILGGRANVHPQYYGEEPILINGAEQPFDKDRDELSKTLILTALGQNIPLLGICRGFQELAVALNGRLVQNLGDHLHENPHPSGYLSEDQKFHDAHSITVQSGTFLANPALGASEFMVNSVHEQGLLIAPFGTVVEATCDNVIEAFSVLNHPYARGVQWHPEWRSDPLSQFVLSTFLKAVLEHSAHKGPKLQSAYNADRLPQPPEHVAI